MNKYFYIVFCLELVVCVYSCKKGEDLHAALGSVYGTVVDKITGEPVGNADVELSPTGLKHTTGSDGTFEFTKVEAGKYNLIVTKSGYKDFRSNEIVVKGNSDDKPVSIQIEMLPPALTVVDDNKKEIDSVDFGSDDGVTMRSFNIFNKSEKKLNWEISHDCQWIKFSKEQGNLEANESQSIVVIIERNKLSLGTNSAIVHITSNNGSKELKILASTVNVVETLQPSNISSQSAALNARIVRNMQPAIVEYGFVYSKKPSPSLTNGAIKKKWHRNASNGQLFVLGR
ncbi:MAG: carboxypeptidase regulatory-like domain-containing protein [Paludibacteraceae bacterium]|nr:carboxypeptidase regulatory-like domain-containing protein [Paludibacteraceae bacterium]